MRPSVPISASSRRRPVAPPAGAPSQFGPWFTVNSPWRTAIPANWSSFVHPDTPSMVQGVYVGTDFTANDIHAWAYRSAEMQAKWGSAGLNFMKWLGPGHYEAIMYPPASTPLVRVWIDSPSYKASSVMLPIPSDWTGFAVGTAQESRTTIAEANGDMHCLTYMTTPGQPNTFHSNTVDTEWHTVVYEKLGVFGTGGWLTSNPLWSKGGSGLPEGVGVITPRDIVNTPPGGWYDHALALNWCSNASPINCPHPTRVYPITVNRPTDGKCQTIVGIPYGARVFLDPSLTDADLISLGVTKEWQLQICRTFQHYGAMGKEGVSGQGDAGGILCESKYTVDYNIAHGIPGYPANFQWPWVADGTGGYGYPNMDAYAAALPPALVPTSGSRWKVFDWTKSYAGITA